MTNHDNNDNMLWLGCILTLGLGFWLNRRWADGRWWWCTKGHAAHNGDERPIRKNNENPTARRRCVFQALIEDASPPRKLTKKWWEIKFTKWGELVVLRRWLKIRGQPLPMAARAPEETYPGNTLPVATVRAWRGLDTTGEVHFRLPPDHHITRDDIKYWNWWFDKNEHLIQSTDMLCVGMEDPQSLHDEFVAEEFAKLLSRIPVKDATLTLRFSVGTPVKHPVSFGDSGFWEYLGEHMACISQIEFYNSWLKMDGYKCAVAFSDLILSHHLDAPIVFCSEHHGRGGVFIEKAFFQGLLSGFGEMVYQSLGPLDPVSLLPLAIILWMLPVVYVPTDPCSAKNPLEECIRLGEISPPAARHPTHNYKQAVKLWPRGIKSKNLPYFLEKNSTEDMFHGVATGIFKFLKGHYASWGMASLQRVERKRRQMEQHSYSGRNRAKTQFHFHMPTQE